MEDATATGAPTGGLESLDRALETHRRFVLAAVLLLAAVVRIVGFVELREGPVFDYHRWEETDMNFFDRWARGVLAGDRLSRRTGHPQHAWHLDIAQAYFAAHPAVAADYRERLGTGDSAAMSRALWDKWFRGNQLHQEPLYPYLIAASYRLFGPDPRWIIGLQLGLGLLMTGLIFSLAGRWFGATAGLVAGLLAAFCLPLLFYEFILVRASLQVFFTVLAVWAVDRALRRAGPRAWFVAGLVLGLAILIKSTFVLFGLGVALVLAWFHRGNLSALVRPAAALGVGVLLCLLPVLGRNLAVGAPPLSLSSVGAMSFASSNIEGTGPLGLALYHAPEKCAAVMASSEGGFLGSVIASIGTHPGAGSYISLLLQKLDAALASREIPNNVNVQYAGIHSKLLRHLPITFGVILAPALLGLGLAVRRYRDSWPLLLMLGCNGAFLIGWHVLARYRAQLLVTLIPFAALGVVALVNWIARRQWRSAALAVLVIAVAVTYSYRPRPHLGPALRYADLVAPFDFHYLPRMERMVSESRPEDAITVLVEFLQTEPESIRRLGPEALPADIEEFRLADYYGRKHLAAANGYRSFGNDESAQAHMQRARALNEACRLKQQEISRDQR